jgi:hypothetical protein
MDMPQPTKSSSVLTTPNNFAPVLPSVQLPPIPVQSGGQSQQLGASSNIGAMEPPLNSIQTFQRSEVRPVAHEITNKNPDADVKVINLNVDYFSGEGGGSNAEQIEAELKANNTSDEFAPDDDLLSNGHTELSEAMGGSSAVEQEIFI